jgi:hypothetical protein
MTLFRQALLRLAALAGIAGALVSAPAFGQPPSPGAYTYSYGYNPGYYGSSVRPCDSGCKPGQAVVHYHGQYRWVYHAPQPPQGTPGARPLQSR